MRVVDLFCGCGGMSLGFEKAGFDIVAAFDKWDEAVSVYNLNFAHPAHLMDLADIKHCTEFISTTYNPDMIIGGPPCQDFSSAGKRDEDNGRGDLTVNYAEIIKGRFLGGYLHRAARIHPTKFGGDPIAK